MKPLAHAKNSARKYGGRWEDYIEIHDFFDSSKATLGDMRHRAVLHSTFGIFLVERVFGTVITNSDGRDVKVFGDPSQPAQGDTFWIALEQRLAKAAMDERVRGGK